MLRVAWMLQVSWIRSGKQEQEKNSPNLGLPFNRALYNPPVAIASFSAGGVQWLTDSLAPGPSPFGPFPTLSLWLEGALTRCLCHLTWNLGQECVHVRQQESPTIVFGVNINPKPVFKYGICWKGSNCMAWMTDDGALSWNLVCNISCKTWLECDGNRPEFPLPPSGTAIEIWTCNRCPYPHFHSVGGIWGIASSFFPPGFTELKHLRTSWTLLQNIAHGAPGVHAQKLDLDHYWTMDNWTM